MTAFAMLAVSCITLLAAQAELACSTLPPGWHSVAQHGVAGDTATDDTAAFQAALEAAAPSGGTVLVPPRGPGEGYVITRTVRIPPGVTLMGSPSGFGTDTIAAYPLPEMQVRGSKILARPAPDQYEGEKKAPLFVLGNGATARGLFILYDQQPMPSDDAFTDPASQYHYPDFETARARFIADHVKPYGPTFYAEHAVNTVLEDITCDRYVDFMVFRRSGKNFANRIFCYGYGRSFAYGEALDVNRLSHIHGVPNVGPVSPGKALGKTFSWIYGIIASSPDNVGVQMGVCDGYTFDDVFFFGVHTALRIGASRAFPFYDPVQGDRWFRDPETGEQTGFSMDYPGAGPWGEATGFKADQCTVGIHFVWPAHQPNRFANLLLFTSVDDGLGFDAAKGSGPLEKVGRQTPFLVEPTFSVENNVGLLPLVMMSNVHIASFNDAGRFGPAGANALDANGRLFLIDGDISMQVSNINTNYPYTPDYLSAVSAGSKEVSVRLRNFTMNGRPAPDMDLEEGVFVPAP